METKEQLTIRDVRGAVARGWCADENAQKVMDPDLAEAISLQVCELFGVSTIQPEE